MSSVHRLHEGPQHFRSTNNISHGEHGDNDMSSRVESIGNLHNIMRQRSEESLHRSQTPGFQFERSCSSPREECIEIGGCMKRNNFTLELRHQHNIQSSNSPCIRVFEEDPIPLMKDIKGHETKDLSVNQVFRIDLGESGETITRGVTLHLTFNTKEDVDMDYLVLQQPAGSTEWQNISDMCTTKEDTFEIPVGKSSKVWVIRFKKSFEWLKRAFLAAIHYHVLFHVMVYFLKMSGKVNVRIIGISEEEYQNLKGLKTAVEVAKELGFRKLEECVPMKLLKKGCLNVNVYKNGKVFHSHNFDMGRTEFRLCTTCSIDLCDLRDKLEVKIFDKKGNLLWSINLNELLPAEVQDPVQHPTNIIKPDISGFEEEVCEHHIPWLAHRLNKDVEKVARFLKVDSDVIEDIEYDEPVMEKRNIRMLNRWRQVWWKKTAIPGRNTATWQQIKSALEDEEIRRYDVLRAILNDEKIDQFLSNEVFLWLVSRVAAYWVTYAKILNLPQFEIETLSCASGGAAEEQCSAMLRRWRQRTKEPTVEVLVQALEHDCIRKYDFAKEMREKFCKDN